MLSTIFKGKDVQRTISAYIKCQTQYDCCTFKVKNRHNEKLRACIKARMTVRRLNPSGLRHLTGPPPGGGARGRSCGVSLDYPVVIVTLIRQASLDAW